MAVTPLTPVSLANYRVSTVVDPEAWSAGNAVDGNTIPNGGTTLVGMYNDGVTERTVVQRVANVDGNTTTGGITYTLAAGTVEYTVLGPSRYYGDPVLLVPSHADVKIRAFTF
jgi:hypothetical protein